MLPKKLPAFKNYHWHHIIPKHDGGTDEPTNLVLLSPLAHAYAHLIRYEETGNTKDLASAKILMGSLGENGSPVDMTGIKRETPAWNKGLTGYKNINYPKTRAKRLPDNRGKKISQALTGRKLSDEHRSTMSIVRKGKSINKILPIVCCPHCNKEGKELIMNRWHFNNCKQKSPD